MNLFEKNISVLKESPVYAMSLGSKELFHSNFWEYLINQDETRGLINCFFEEINLSDFKCVEREDKNRDLVIYTNDGKQFVVENKIKSYPDKEQLEKYTKETHLDGGVITGIKEPPFELPEKWKFVSYSSIAKILREIKISNNYLNLIVDDYCNVLDAINELMEMSLKETERRLSYWTKNIGLLYKVRLMDVYRKNKADDFALYCQDIIDEINTQIKELPNWSVNLSRSFHNGKATLSFEITKRIEHVDYKEYKGQIGVQVEDNQFRLFLGLDQGPSKDVFEKGLNVNWFDPSFNKQNRMIFGHPTTMIKNPCSYSQRWVYQYFDTYNDKNGLKVDIQEYEELKKQIRFYLNKAIDILKRKESEIFPE